jgi:hypothetical protein
VFVVGWLVVFLAASSLEFPTKIFLNICARETLIKEWDTRRNEIIEGVHSVNIMVVAGGIYLHV